MISYKAHFAVENMNSMQSITNKVLIVLSLSIYIYVMILQQFFT